MFVKLFLLKNLLNKIVLIRINMHLPFNIFSFWVGFLGLGFLGLGFLMPALHSIQTAVMFVLQSVVSLNMLDLLIILKHVLELWCVWFLMLIKHYFSFVIKLYYET